MDSGFPRCDGSVKSRAWGWVTETYLVLVLVGLWLVRFARTSCLP